MHLEKFYEKVKNGVPCMAIASLMLLGLTGSVHAQQTVMGTVTDTETGEPLPGVNVAVEGTTRGTATNADGEYSLEVPGPESVLLFFFVGYRSQEVTVGDQEVIDVSLQLDMGRHDTLYPKMRSNGSRANEDSHIYIS